MRKDLLVAIIIGGLVAGTLDIGAAALIGRTGPITIMKAISGGLLGKSAVKEGGAPAAALGFALQLFMGVLIAAIYGLASTRLPVLTQRWLPCGLAYGVATFVVMNFVVVPLSALRVVPHFKPLSFAENMAAMLLFGVIVAFAAYRGSATPAV